MTYGAAATLYFSSVKTNDHPYAEAAFLERIGCIWVTALHQDIETTAHKSTGPIFLVGVNYIKPEFPLAISAVFETSKIEDDIFSGNGYTKLRRYSFSIGNYFLPALLAGVEYSSLTYDYVLPGFLSLSSKIMDYGLFAKYASELPNGTVLLFKGSIISKQTDDKFETFINTNLSLSIDYFFTRSLSAGVGIENSSGNNNNEVGRTQSLNVDYFFTPQFSVKTTYDNYVNADNNDLNSNSVGIIAAVRF